MYSSVVDDVLLQIQMSADVGLIDRACGDVTAFLAEKGLPQLDFDINLILREALCNAIVHGSQGDTHNNVQVAIEYGAEIMTLRVSDSGAGWNWRAHDWSPPPPVNECGRGLFIIRNYADAIQFNEQGNEIVITKRYAVQENGMDTIKQQGSREVVMGPSLSAGTLDQYRTDFKSFIDGGTRELVLNCSDLEIVDSMGIGLLVATHNSLTKVGGELVMINTPEPVYNLMSTMRLNRHFTVKRA